MTTTHSAAFLVPSLIPKTTRLVLLLFFLTGCCSRLSVQTDYLSKERLASYYVGAPDPQLNCDTIGQRLVISWSLSREDFIYQNVAFHLKVRLRNHEEIEVCKNIICSCGYYIFQLNDEKYRQSGGILTYKVTLTGDDTVLETWRHPLWKELITLGGVNKSANN